MYPFKLKNLAIARAKREAEKSMMNLQSAVAVHGDKPLQDKYLDAAYVANKKAFEWIHALLEIKE